MPCRNFYLFWRGERLRMRSVKEVVPCEFQQRMSWIGNNQRFTIFTWFVTVIRIQSQLCDSEEYSYSIWDLMFKIRKTSKYVFSRIYKTQIFTVKWKYLLAYIYKCVPVKHPIRAERHAHQEGRERKVKWHVFNTFCPYNQSLQKSLLSIRI